jgi:hypothetical protein
MAKQSAFDAFVEGNLHAEITGQTGGVPRVSIYQLIGGGAIRDQIATFYSIDAFTLVGGFATIDEFNTAMANRREAFNRRAPA